MLYVRDVYALFQRVAGGKGAMPPTGMFWGDRCGQVEDPFGHVWAIAWLAAAREVGARQRAKRGRVTI